MVIGDRFVVELSICWAVVFTREFVPFDDGVLWLAVVVAVGMRKRFGFHVNPFALHALRSYSRFAM